MKYDKLNDKTYIKNSVPTRQTINNINKILALFSGKEWSCNTNKLGELDKIVKNELKSNISTSTLRRHGILRYEIINNKAYAAIK